MSADVLAPRIDSGMRPTGRLRPVATLPRPAAALDPIRVVVLGADLTSGDEILRLLDSCPDLLTVSEVAGAEVAVVVTDRLNERVVDTLRALARHRQLRVALVVDDWEIGNVARCLQAGAIALLRRSEAGRVGLGRVIRSVAAGQAVLPADALRALAGRPAADGARSANLNSLNEREVRVIVLLAEGSDTREVAQRLCYSERTVKAIIQDITARFGLRNRSHVVAFALREGLI